MQQRPILIIFGVIPLGTDCVSLSEVCMKVKSKVCTKCNKRKLIKYFSKNNTQCKKCKVIYARKYRKTHKDTRNRTEYRKEYYELNKKRFQKWNKIWRKNNNRNDYHKKYRNNNPSAKIASYCRNRIRLAIKNSWKSESSLSLTGCNNWNELMLYLESKFQTGMSWDNMGDWHIDHIKPCSSFDLTKIEEQKKCFHYSNLQPLWAKDNLSKSNKY